MGNINIEIPDELHKKLKLKALINDSTLKDFVISVIARNLSLSNKQVRKKGFK